MDIPAPPYVGVYGTHDSKEPGDPTWRGPVMDRLADVGIAAYDPTDHAGWDPITEENGDAYQTTVDALVAKQHDALTGAACVIHNLLGIVNGEPTTSHAARAELAFLAAAGIPTFFVIQAGLPGRNYLWALTGRYEHMHRCGDVPEATERAIGFMQARKEGGPA